MDMLLIYRAFVESFVVIQRPYTNEYCVKDIAYKYVCVVCWFVQAIIGNDRGSACNADIGGRDEEDKGP